MKDTYPINGVFPFRHHTPWTNDVPSFGEEIISGITPIADTNRTVAPTVINRAPANLKNTSAFLTGRLVDTGLGILPTNPTGTITTTFLNNVGLSHPTLGEINATSISQSSANLQGSLLSTGGETPIITIVWGDEDHGADFSNLANWDFNQSLGYTDVGPFSTPVGGLNERSIYYFRVAVSNSIRSFMSSDVGVFVTDSGSSLMPDPALWLDANDTSASTGTWIR